MGFYAERSLALSYAEDGELREAEAALTALVERLERDATGNSAADLARVLCDRGNVRAWSIRPNEALEDLERSRTLAEGLKFVSRHAIRMSTFNVLIPLFGAPYSPLRDDARADAEMAAMRAELAAPGERWMADAVEMRLAQQRKQWGRVAELAPSVIDALAAGGLVRGVEGVRNVLARALLQLGRPDDARAPAASAWEFFRVQGPPDIAAQAAVSLARASAPDDEAWRLIEEGLGRIESLVRAQRSLFDQQRYLVEKTQAYDDALRFALGAAASGGGSDVVARAWAIAERAKSFSLRQAMTQGGWLRGIDPTLAEELAALDARIDALEMQQGRSDESVALQGELSARRQALMERAMLASPLAAKVEAHPPLDLPRTLAALGEGVGAISWYWLDGTDGWELHVFHAGTDRVARHAMTRWSGEGVARLEAAQHEARTKPLLFVDPLLPTELGDAIFPPSVLAALAGCHTIVATPHRALRLLPLHAAQVTGAGWLFDRFALQLLPTLALPFPDRTGEVRGRALLLGCVQDGFGHPSLPQVDDELTDIAAIWTKEGHPARAHPLAPDECLTGDVALPEWPSYDVIHLACHGTFDPKAPLDATLYLGRDSVRAADLFSFALTARLVALSACDVGQQADAVEGMSLASSEWLGIALPLFQSGAKTLLSSLWEANSEVAYDFMKCIHAALARGASPAIAYQEACREQVALETPYGMWANWQLAGFPA